MRDPNKLTAFQLADQLVMEVYKATKSFPRDELFGLTSQMRRAAISITSNIVEGCARNSEADYLHFLDMAYESAQELTYQVSLAIRLGYMPTSIALMEECVAVARVLNGLIQSLRHRK
ncbi:MAG: four helix bundle protein [Verrucomicrobia bacterium]|nr:MAG: four helix bundle protein [Verrucomicrobiota bacterium]